MNNILSKWFSTVTSTIVAILITSLVIGSVVYMQGAYARESMQNQQISVLENQLQKTREDLHAQEDKYNALKNILIEVRNNQKHIIKQLDRLNKK